MEGVAELFEKCKALRNNSIVKNYALVTPDFSDQKITMHYANLMSVVDGSLKNFEAQKKTY